MSVTKEFWTPAELAGSYPVSKSLIYGACQTGLLPHYRIPAKRGARGKYLIKIEDFLAWLESNRHEGGASEPPPAAMPAKQPFVHLQL